ncbi:glycosyltransferase [Ruegeria sp. HKCCA5426]|uniref:nucleotide disphospho-sugar-binding domain-containing protein n=1 Tax=Ruegeria sp. HKCCA5426 TaxID=2682985 RepID=UPI0014897788|nr:glycosyltransferase [Ruegeria sp. HKCCA5426]
MSKRLAIISSGLNSPLSSAVEFAQQARDTGFKITFLAPVSSASILAHAGLEHFIITGPKFDAFTPLVPSETARSMTRQERLKSAVAAFEVDELQRDLARISADAIFVDCELHAHIVVAMTLGVPVVQFSNMFLSPPSPQAPPLNRHGIPGQGLRGSKLGICLLWAQFLAWKNLKILRNRISSKSTDYPTAVQELARLHNVPISKLRRRVCWQMPWTYKIQTALFLPQALDLPTKPYDYMTYLGPMIMENRPQKSYDANTVARFCDPALRRRRIFVGFGTMMKTKGDLVSKLLTVAERHPEWHFLFTAGKDWDHASELPAPDNVDVVPWVPQHRVLEHADMAIMHGGTGSLVEAVETATPLLLYPHVNDQKGSAARVVFHRIGRAGTPKDPIDKIEADIHAVLEDRDMARRCRDMQAECRAEQSGDTLERYLRTLVG